MQQLFEMNLQLYRADKCLLSHSFKLCPGYLSGDCGIINHKDNRTYKSGNNTVLELQDLSFQPGLATKLSHMITFVDLNFKIGAWD